MGQHTLNTIITARGTQRYLHLADLSLSRFRELKFLSWYISLHPFSCLLIPTLICTPVIPNAAGSLVSSPLPCNTITKGVTSRTNDIFHTHFKHWPHLAQSSHPLLSCHQPPLCPYWTTGRRKNLSILFAKKFLFTITSVMERVASQDNSIQPETFKWALWSPASDCWRKGGSYQALSVLLLPFNQSSSELLLYI